MKFYTYILILVLALVTTGCETGTNSGRADGVTGVVTNYAWDGFTDSDGNTVYSCRNINTREYVDNKLCSGPRNDNTWPN